MQESLQDCSLAGTATKVPYQNSISRAAFSWLLPLQRSRARMLRHTQKLQMSSSPVDQDLAPHDACLEELTLSLHLELPKLDIDLYIQNYVGTTPPWTLELAWCSTMQ